jgi:Immunity protein 26
MPVAVRTNIQVLKPSRKRLVPGDVFRVCLPDASFIFGRVIRVDLPRESAPMPGANLVHVYRQRTDSSEPDLDALTPGELLIPPLFINLPGC